MITLAAAVSTNINGYDVLSVGVDFSATPKIVTIRYVQTDLAGVPLVFPGIGAPVLSLTMTLAQFDAAAGTTLRLRALNALAGPNGLNLTGATVT